MQFSLDTLQFRFCALLCLLLVAAPNALAFAVLPFPVPDQQAGSPVSGHLGSPSAASPTAHSTQTGVPPKPSSTLPAAPTPTASSVVLDPLSDRVIFSPGWDPVLSPSFPQQLQVIPETSDPGAFVDIALPGGTTDFSFVGFKSTGGASYVACVNCEAPVGGNLQFVDGHDPDANGTTTPSVLFTFAGLDAAKNHTVTIFNLPDPRFGNQGTLNMVSCISNVLLANSPGSSPPGQTTFSEPPETSVAPPTTIAPPPPPVTSATSTSVSIASSTVSTTAATSRSSDSVGASSSASPSASSFSSTVSASAASSSATAASTSSVSGSNTASGASSQTSSSTATSSAPLSSGTDGSNGSGGGSSNSGSSSSRGSSLSPVLTVVIVILALLALISLLFGLWVLMRARRARAAAGSHPESGRPPSEIIGLNTSTEAMPPQSLSYSEMRMEGFIPYRPPVSIPQNDGVGNVPVPYDRGDPNSRPHPYVTRQLTTTGLPTGPRTRPGDLYVDTAAAGYGQPTDVRRRNSYHSLTTASEYSQDHLQEDQERSNPFADRGPSARSHEEESASQSSYDPVLAKATAARHPYGPASSPSYALAVANSTSAEKLQMHSNNSSAERVGMGSTWLSRVPRTPI